MNFDWAKRWLDSFGDLDRMMQMYAEDVDFEDVKAVAISVLRHRIVLNFHARAEGIDVDEIVRRLLNQVRPK